MIELSKHKLLINTKYETSAQQKLQLNVTGSGVKIGVGVKYKYFPTHSKNLYYQFIEINNNLFLLLSTIQHDNYYTATSNGLGYILSSASVRALLYNDKPMSYKLEFEKTDNKDILAFKLLK